MSRARGDLRFVNVESWIILSQQSVWCVADGGKCLGMKVSLPGDRFVCHRSTCFQLMDFQDLVAVPLFAMMPERVTELIKPIATTLFVVYRMSKQCYGEQREWKWREEWKSPPRS
jgi:hypothetical protein